MITIFLLLLKQKTVSIRPHLYSYVICTAAYCDYLIVYVFGVAKKLIFVKYSWKKFAFVRVSLLTTSCKYGILCMNTIMRKMFDQSKPPDSKPKVFAADSRRLYIRFEIITVAIQY